MASSRCLRSAVVIATTLVCLLGLTSPVSATAFINGAGPTGTLIVTQGAAPPMEIPLSGPATHCVPSGLTVDVTPTAAAPASVDITSLGLISRFTVWGSSYVAVTTRTGSVAGTAGSVNPVDDVGLSVLVSIHTPASGTLCQPGSLQCRYLMSFTLSGQHSGFPITSGNSTMTLSAPPTTVAMLSPCLFPFSLYNGGLAQVNLMGFPLV